MNNNIHARILTLITYAIVVWRLTFRDITSDTYFYVNRFLAMSGSGLKEALDQYTNDRLFYFILWVCSRITESPRIFLCIMGMIFLFFFAKFINNMFTPWQSLFVVFTYALFPFFYNNAANVMRQGFAILIILIAATYYIKDEKHWSKTLLLLVSACLFHWSAAPFSAILLLMKKFNFGLKFSITTWAVAASIYLSGMQSKLLSPLTPYIPKFEWYENASIGRSGANLVGNRLDFFLFSVVILLIGLLLYRFYCRDERFARVLNAYVLFNTIFLLMGFIAYSDRIAVYSWFLLPVIIWLPLFIRRQYYSLYAFAVLLVFVTIGIITGIYTKINISA